MFACEKRREPTRQMSRTTPFAWPFIQNIRQVNALKALQIPISRRPAVCFHRSARVHENAAGHFQKVARVHQNFFHRAVQTNRFRIHSVVQTRAKKKTTPSPMSSVEFGLDCSMQSVSRENFRCVQNVSRETKERLFCFASLFSRKFISPRFFGARSRDESRAH